MEREKEEKTSSIKDKIKQFKEKKELNQEMEKKINLAKNFVSSNEFSNPFLTENTNNVQI